MSILVGKFFVHHTPADVFQTGVVEGEVTPGFFLVRYDWSREIRGEVDARPPCPSASLLNLEAMSKCCEATELFFEFFDSREELETYVEWMASPPKTDGSSSSPNVLKLTRK